MDPAPFFLSKRPRLMLLFKDTRRYFMKPTTACVIAYYYARIRRLVHLEGRR